MPTTAEPQVAVIIVNYKSSALVSRCIDSLRKHLHHRLLVIVVDNSVPSERAVLSSNPDIVVLSPPQNNGFAAGCNLGLALAHQRGIAYALLLNPDARTESDFLTPLLRVMERNKRVGVVAPRILDDDPHRRIQFAGGIVKWCRGGPRHLFRNRPPAAEGWYDDAFLTGCALLLRLTAVHDAGSLDEDYFLYFEDADYIQKLRAHGWQTAYTPDATILHQRNSTTGFQSELYVYYFSRNRLIFLHRWAHPVCFWYYLAFATLVKLPGSILIFGMARRQWRVAQAFWKGYRVGLQYIFSRQRPHCRQPHKDRH